MAEDESGSKGQSKGLPFLYLLTHFEMGNGRSIAVGQTAEGVSQSVVRLPGMYGLISYRRPLE